MWHNACWWQLLAAAASRCGLAGLRLRAAERQRRLQSNARFWLMAGHNFQPQEPHQPHRIPFIVVLLILHLHLVASASVRVTNMLQLLSVDNEVP